MINRTLTQVSGQVEAHSGEDTLPAQTDCLWLKESHLQLEGLMEQLWDTRQVID